MLIPVMIEMIKMNKLIFLAIIPVLLVPNVYAGGPRGDSPEDSMDGTRSCVTVNVYMKKWYLKIRK